MIVEPQPLTKERCLWIAEQIEDGFKQHNMHVRARTDIDIFIKDMRWLAVNLDSNPTSLGEKKMERWINAFLRTQQAMD